jgi:hypothetical protein
MNAIRKSTKEEGGGGELGGGWVGVMKELHTGRQGIGRGVWETSDDTAHTLTVTWHN